MTQQELRSLLFDVTYENFVFHSGPLGDGFFLQVEFLAPDNSIQAHVGAYDWKGRKWYVSAHSTDSEVILTALKAVLTALEHEAREKFKFRGRAILHPHPDLEVLWQVAEEREVRA